MSDRRESFTTLPPQSDYEMENVDEIRLADEIVDLIKL